MGEVRTTLTLENSDDRESFLRGHAAEGDIGQVTVDGIVDPGTVSLVVTEELATRLGLRRFSRAQRPVAGPVTVRIGDRETITDCVIGPPQSQTVVGYTVLAMLDLVTDEASGTLRPRHPEGIVWRV